MQQDPELVAKAVYAVRGAADLHDALESMVQVLRPRFDLWFACLAAHPSGGEHITVLASWSLAENMFDAGAKISPSISATVESVLSTLREGRGATFTVGADPDSLVDHLLHGQGVASVLTFPVHLDADDLILLALGASSKDAFRDAEKGFFTALSDGISSVVLRLATAANG